MTARQSANKPNGPQPEAYAASGTEHAHQTALFMWSAQAEVRAQYPELKRMFAIPNGGQRDKITAARLKAEGVRKGVLDVMLPIARHGMHGLFIELKRPKTGVLTKGVVSDSQNEEIEALRADGYGACTCYGWEAARDILKEYLS